MASSSTGTLPDEVLWEELPEELLMRVLGHVILRNVGLGPQKWGCSAVRGVSRQWRAVHDGTCQQLCMDDGVTDEGMHMLCGRLPSLTYLSLWGVASLTANGLCAVGGLTTLTILNLDLNSCNVTDVVLRELRGLTKLTGLSLRGCSNVTDEGLQHISSLPALIRLNLSRTSTTHAGRNALKAALPALTIIG